VHWAFRILPGMPSACSPGTPAGGSRSMLRPACVPLSGCRAAVAHHAASGLQVARSTPAGATRAHSAEQPHQACVSILRSVRLGNPRRAGGSTAMERLPDGGRQRALPLSRLWRHGRRAMAWRRSDAGNGGIHVSAERLIRECAGNVSAAAPARPAKRRAIWLATAAARLRPFGCAAGFLPGA